MIEKNVKLWIGDGPLVTVRVSQFDTMWRFIFSIVNNSQPWEIPSGASAVLNGRKPDGNVFAFSGTIEDNKVTVDCDVQMTAVAGQTVCELSILADGKTVGTANFILDVEEAPKSDDDVVSDTVLDGYGMMVTNAVDSWLNSHSGQIGGLTNEAKQALLTLLAHVAYTDDQGQTYLDALETALYPPVDLLSISAVFNQGDVVIYDTDELDVLKQYLTVTANYSDRTTETVTNYTLSGTLTEGTSTITVSYGGKEASFDAIVTKAISFHFEPHLSGGTRTASNPEIMFYVNATRASLVSDDTSETPIIAYNNSQDTTPRGEYYPVAVPNWATKVKCTCPGYTWGIAYLSYDSGTKTYTRTADAGWQSLNGSTHTLDRTHTIDYVFINLKYGSAGSATIDSIPDSVTVEFIK